MLADLMLVVHFVGLIARNHNMNVISLVLLIHYPG